MSRRLARIALPDSCVMSSPLITIFPEVGGSRPISSRPVVDFPQPLSPTIARVSPWLR